MVTLIRDYSLWFFVERTHRKQKYGLNAHVIMSQFSIMFQFLETLALRWKILVAIIFLVVFLNMFAWMSKTSYVKYVPVRWE